MKKLTKGQMRALVKAAESVVVSDEQLQHALDKLRSGLEQEEQHPRKKHPSDTTPHERWLSQQDRRD